MSYDFRPLVMSVICSIGAYPLITTLFERWYNQGFFLAAAFDTFRVYEKSFNKECATSSILLQIFIVVLSLLPDYLHVVITYLRTYIRILRYHQNQVHKNAINGGAHAKSRSSLFRNNTVGCCDVSKMFKTKRSLDCLERGGRRKSYGKSSVMPLETSLNKKGPEEDQSKSAFNSSSFDKPLQPLNANLLQSDMTLSSSISETKLESGYVSELVNIPEHDKHQNEASTSRNLMENNRNGLSANIANILFHRNTSENQTKLKLNSLERNSLSMAVSYNSSREELTETKGHFRPPFEKTAKIREEQCDNSDVPEALSTNL